MTPKEKAKELVDKMRDDLWEKRCIKIYLEDAKLCILIVVDEIIKLRKGYFDCTNKMQDESYWQEVKQEIEKL